MRFFIDLSYVGSDFHGWQKQPNALSVQEVVESCFAKVFRTPVQLVGAGRTDAGVHARQLIAHFDREKEFSIPQLLYRLNRMLPASIAAQEIYPVKENAHARFDAVSREYHYHLVTTKNPFETAFSLYYPYHLDVKKMNEACKILRVHRDFQSFSKVKTDVKTYLCTIQKAEWVLAGDRLVFVIIADRFLRNMVRAIVGTLLEVGRGKLSLSGLETILAHKNRSEAGISVEAKGLVLHSINYPESIKQKEDEGS